MRARSPQIRNHVGEGDGPFEPARLEPELYEPIVPGGPDVLAQALYAVEHEAAVTADDILRRRTTVALRGFEAEGRVRVSPFLPGRTASEGDAPPH